MGLSFSISEDETSGSHDHEQAEKKEEVDRRFAMSQGPTEAYRASTYKGPELFFNSRRSPVMSTKGMVTCSQHLAAQVGMQVLRDGGNAADAAVAIAAAQNVCQPTSTGMGGDAFVLFYSAKDKKVYGLNATGKSPENLTLERARADVGWETDKLPHHHPHCVTVPGGASSLIKTNELWGTMSLERLLAPAIKMCEEGVPVNVITSWLWNGDSTMKGQLDQTPFGGEILMPNGQPPQPGDIWKNPNLATTFRRMAEKGMDGFYKGPTAEAIVEVLQGMGGVMTLDDLARHQPMLVEPISVNYRGVDVWEIPPNGQGITALIALNILNELPVSKEHNSAEHLHKVIEAIRLAFADTRWFVTDPKFSGISHEEYLSKEYAQKRAKLIDMNKATVDFKKGSPLSSSDTVAFHAVDDEGNACSFIISNYKGFGTGIVPKGTGITLHNRGNNFNLEEGHPNTLEPGKRPFSTIIPGMMTKDGEFHASFSVMGGFNQPQGHAQVVVNMIDFGMNPQEAVDVPRFVILSGFEDGVVNIEDSVPEEVIDELRKMGHPIKVVSSHQRKVCGRGHIIARYPNGVLWGGADGRADGSAVPQL